LNSSVLIVLTDDSFQFDTVLLLEISQFFPKLFLPHSPAHDYRSKPATTALGIWVPAQYQLSSDPSPCRNHFKSLSEEEKVSSSQVFILLNLS